MFTALPNLVACIFAAYVYGGPDVNLHQYQPLAIPNPECGFVAWVDEDNFHLERNGYHVSVPLPTHQGWYRFQYYWGQDFAYFSSPNSSTWYEVPVRAGPKGFY